MFGMDVPPAALAVARARLSRSDREWADRASPSERRRRIARRSVLRRVLSEQFGVPERDLRIERRPSGKPELANPEAHGWSFSTSDCGQLGIVAIAPAPAIGVDIEAISRWDRAVLDEGWLHPAEVNSLQSLPRRRRGAAVTRCWTQKEAISKASGLGLRSDFAAIECTPDGGPHVTAGLAVSTFTTRAHAMSLAVGK
jgi:4'-phosphopantetheinyl transferase